MKTEPNDSVGNTPSRADKYGFFQGSPGLTKREYFAAMAMQGVEASNVSAESGISLSTTESVKRAVAMADLLIFMLNETAP